MDKRYETFNEILFESYCKTAIFGTCPKVLKI